MCRLLCVEAVESRLVDDSCNNNCLSHNDGCQSAVTPLCSLLIIVPFLDVPFSSLHPDSLAGNQSFFTAKPNLILAAAAFTTFARGPSRLEMLSAVDGSYRSNDGNSHYNFYRMCLCLAAVTIFKLSFLFHPARWRFPAITCFDDHSVLCRATILCPPA